MALKNSETFKGIQITDAYVKVETITILSDKSTMEIIVQFKADESSPPFRGESFISPYSYEEGNPFEQAYEYLKSLPEFSEAVDH